MVTVRISDGAKVEFGKLPAYARARVNAVFARLASWPDVSGAKPLRGDKHGTYRLRTGDYRVLFTVVGAVLTVTKIGDRRDVYED